MRLCGSRRKCSAVPIGEDITITLKLQEDPWHVLIDPSQIDQILANLSVNARDAIEGVGTLLIETKNVHLNEEYSRHDMTIQEGDFALLSITDSGSGMDAETLDHAFEPFYTTKEVGEGTGLGLATVYGIVKQNNGVIHVYSEVGMGTTFKIYLPRYTGQLPKRKEREESEKTSGKETILIVEDEAAILNLTKRYLEQSGYTILAASNPMEAIGIAHDFEGQIDLLLSDVVMPGMDGKALETKLRKIKPGIKTMFMSGYSANVIEQRGILDEGIEFIEKPFTMRALTSHIRRIFEE